MDFMVIEQELLVGVPIFVLFIYQKKVIQQDFKDF